MKNRVVFAAPLLVLLASGVASAGFGPNLLNNPGFEDPLGFDFSNPSNWNGFFGGPAGTVLEAFNDTGATPHGGVQALVTTIRGVAGVTDGFNAFTGHVQIVTGLTGGLTYELSVWARTNPLVLDGAEFRVEWQDAAGVEISRFNSDITLGLTPSYTQFGITQVAPAGTARAAIVVAVQSFAHTGPLADTSVAWDDASFRTVPGPGAAALLALGGVFAGRRRR
ncbi:MAG: hypothetical protein H7210_00630 [Pyrinomonadaceae bacterium]|nr:hypothetical protein [Phycisphaerales bacterium]